jgi:hypothetical protein
VLNLFDLRATSPKALAEATDPVSPENGSTLAHWLCDNVPNVILAWGSHRMARERGRLLVYRLRQWGVDPYCLGVTRMGDPRHPLYLPKRLRPVPFDWENTESPEPAGEVVKGQTRK